MIRIYYDIKNTSATTEYMDMNKEDMNTILMTLVSIQGYFAELSLCSDQDVKDLLKWYKTSNKTLPFHSKWKKHNSPQTFISGTINNIMFGTQSDLSVVQGQHLQNLIGTCADFIEALKDMKIDLQKTCKVENILLSLNLWENK